MELGTNWREDCTWCDRWEMLVKEDSPDLTTLRVSKE